MFDKSHKKWQPIIARGGAFLENQKTKKVHIVGHKNPDTDSICSAITYADLKSKISNEQYIANRAGLLNEETQYVLNRFGVEEPSLLSNVHLQVQDVDVNRTPGIRGNTSIKEAWTMMKEQNVYTIAVTNNQKLEGIITTGDIATSYMDEYDSHILANARTQYQNIVDTVDGEVVTGNPHAYFIKGKVVVAASSPDMMENFIEKDDLVILGNRYEVQLCAIELNVSCIVVCQGAQVTRTIKKMAEERNIVVIATPHDTFTVARLINQSIPVKHFMNKDVTVFHTTDYVEEIKQEMAKKRMRDFPVLDKQGNFYGLISSRRLMDASKKRVILVDHNEKTQTVDGIEEAEVLEIIDHHRLGGLETLGPVYFRNQPVGCTATIIYEMYKEQKISPPPYIAGIMMAGIISDTLLFHSPTTTIYDKRAVNELSKIANVNPNAFAKKMFEAASSIKGKTIEELIYNDFKSFNINNQKIGIGQMTVINYQDVLNTKEKYLKVIESISIEHDYDIFAFCITDVINSNTYLLYNEKAKTIFETIFNINDIYQGYELKGVVSRKKQIIPLLMEELQ